MNDNTYALIITPAERRFLLEVMGPPDVSRAFRSYLMAQYLHVEYELTWSLTEADLWVIDSVLFSLNPFKIKTSDGESLVDFATKVWTILAEINGPESLKEANRAKPFPEPYANSNSNSDTGSNLSGEATIHGSSDGSTAG